MNHTLVEKWGRETGRKETKKKSLASSLSPVGKWSFIHMGNSGRHLLSYSAQRKKKLGYFTSTPISHQMRVFLRAIHLHFWSATRVDKVAWVRESPQAKKCNCWHFKVKWCTDVVKNWGCGLGTDSGTCKILEIPKCVQSLNSIISQFIMAKRHKLGYNATW